MKSEAHLQVRCNDEGAAQFRSERGRWNFYGSMIFPLQQNSNSENMEKSRRIGTEDGIIFWENNRAVIELIEANTREHVKMAREIFLRYAQSLDFDLSFQDFTAELAGLPGAYGPPTGCLLLALEKGEAAGCVAFRKIGDGVCEMKRLFIDPQQRGKGIGRILTHAVIQKAKRLGYKRMRLDTVPSMTPAINLYRSLGFEEIPPYCHNPVSGAKFFELQLEPGRCANDST